MGEPESVSVLEQAKEKQRSCAATTTCWITLGLLEGLILEIETLNHRIEALSQNHIVTVRERAEKRQQEG